jgi:hypothetical protein
MVLGMIADSHFEKCNPMNIALYLDNFKNALNTSPAEQARMGLYLIINLHLL